MKKTINVISHPLLIILFFCFLIISGEESAAFYITILMRGLPYHVLQSYLGFSGIILMITGWLLQKKKGSYIVNVVGAFALLASLVIFFLQPGGSYNYNTFRELVPLLLLSLFLLLIALFISRNVRLRHYKTT